MVPTQDDILQINRRATNARIYSYAPGLATAVWGDGAMGGRLWVHAVDGQWRSGLPARRPPAGWPIYIAGDWSRWDCVYIVDDERTADAMARMGLPACCAVFRGERWSNWSPTDGRLAVLWCRQAIHADVVRSLWRWDYMPGDGPIETLKRLWAEHGGDKDAIREEIRWRALTRGGERQNDDQIR